MCLCKFVNKTSLPWSWWLPTRQVLEERGQLHAAWQHKKVYLDQLIDLHFFLRDAKQLDTISSSQEAYLSTADFGNTIEQVDAQVTPFTFTQHSS